MTDDPLDETAAGHPASGPAAAGEPVVAPAAVGSDQPVAPILLQRSTRRMLVREVAFDGLLAVVGFLALTRFTGRVPHVGLLVWDVVATFYLIAGFGRTRRRMLSMTPVVDDQALPPGWVRPIGLLRMVLPMVSSVIGIVASIEILFDPRHGGDGAVAIKWLGVIAMILSWLMLHAGYGRRYEWQYAIYGNTGLTWPNCDHPELGDFLYFAFTVGTTFATSDVEVTDRRMRWEVLVHGVMAFFYNAIVLAVAFAVITSSA